MLMKSNFSRGSSSLAKHFFILFVMLSFYKNFYIWCKHKWTVHWIYHFARCDWFYLVSLPLANWRLECTNATRYYRNIFFSINLKKDEIFSKTWMSLRLELWLVDWAFSGSPGLYKGLILGAKFSIAYSEEKWWKKDRFFKWTSKCTKTK